MLFQLRTIPSIAAAFEGERCDLIPDRADGWPNDAQRRASAARRSRVGCKRLLGVFHFLNPSNPLTYLLGAIAKTLLRPTLILSIVRRYSCNLLFDCSTSESVAAPRAERTHRSTDGRPIDSVVWLVHLA